ncbi:regulator of microtubule dynamics protein 2 isoform 1-T1 [Synchiropus picturatus]
MNYFYNEFGRMAQPDSKVLVLGALAGVAGISMAVVFYKNYKSKRRASCPAFFLDRASGQGAELMMVDGSPDVSRGQLEVLHRLEALIQCVSELKDEMKALKSAIPTLHDQVRGELRGRDASEARRAGSQHRTTPTRRKRTSGSIAVTRPQGVSSEEAESEGGYITALTDSEDEDQSDVELSDEEQLLKDQKLVDLHERIDFLHHGTESDKKESLAILLQHREEFGQNSTFLWRLIRAYCDVHDVTTELENKKIHAESGKRVGEEAVQLNPTCAESHLWYAIMCGIMAEYDTIQNKIKNGFIFKDHLDKAIELKPQDPLSYHLLGRWCYTVTQLSWIERKVAATLSGAPLIATVEDALRNFLKVEELQPGYSKLNYVFLAKCYRDIGQREKARKMCEAACSMDAASKEDEEAQKELSSLCPALGVLL